MASVHRLSTIVINDHTPMFSGLTAVGILVAAVLGAPTTSALAQGLPQHMVAYMAGTSQTKCPNNWTEAAYAQGRLILGTTDGSKVGMTAGTPAGNAQPPRHVHAFTVTGTVSSQSNPAIPGGASARAAGGEVNSSGTTQEWPPLPPNSGFQGPLPFIQFLVCENMVEESPDSAPYGTIAFFNASVCPNNWINQPTAADGRFLLPTPPNSQPGYATATAWDPANPPTHTHSLQASFGTQSAEFEVFPSNPDYFANPGTYPLAGTTEPAGPVLPFVSLLVCEKTVFGNSTGIPLGTAIFFNGEDCPSDWGVTTGADGRFVMGIGGNGSAGATFGGDPIVSGMTSVQHDHGFSGTVSPPASAYPGNPPKPRYGGTQPYVTTADAGYSGTSTAATTEVPYLTVQSCTYTGGQQKPPGGR
jgi:hypothetical protein